MLPRNQRLAQRCLVESENARVPPNLVDKGLQEDALGAGLHVHGPEGWAHPPDTGSREKWEAAVSSGQRVLRSLSVLTSAVCSRLLGLYRPGHSAAAAQSRDASVLLPPGRGT